MSVRPASFPLSTPITLPMSDGAAAPVLRADVALVAVAVPAGEHEVLLRYTAPWVWRGIAVGLLGLALWLGLVVIGRRRR